MVLDIRSPEYRDNPYPAYRRLRAEAPVCRIEPHGYWAVARYADVLSILRNPKLFPSSGIGSEPAQGPDFLIKTRAMIGTDPPDHTRLRGIVSQAFTPAIIRSQEPRIRSLSRTLIQGLLRNDSFDLVSDFSAPLPILFISELLGIDPAKREDFKRWTDTLITWRNSRFIPDPEKRRAREAEIVWNTERMFDYFTDVIAEKGRHPRADLISALVLACDTGQKLTPQEVLSFVRLLLVAGSETTTNLIGNTILALLSHRDQWERVKQDRSKIPRLVEESLRFDSPVLSLTRRVSSDTEIEGVKIAKDELVLPLLASANHDEAQFADPERFDVDRDTLGHLAFGTGIHFCLGAPLARLQVRIALEELFEAFEGFERADQGPLDFIDSFFFRGVKSLTILADRSRNRLG